MKCYNLFIVIICLVLSCSESEETEIIEEIAQGEFMDEWTYKVYPTKADNFYIAEFRIWIPENHDNLRAILILASSYNSNGLGLALHEDWQEYARNENLALLSVHLKSSNSGSYYGSASGGSGDAMIMALKHISEKHNIENINKLPFLARGYSAGGVFSYYLSEFLPERCIAFANIRGGGVDATFSQNKNALGLMIMGENDVESRNVNMKNAVVHKRKESGLWCYAIEPIVDHFGALKKSDALIKYFFSKALEKRLHTNEPFKLQIISESAGWLGNHESQEYFLFDNYPNSKIEASWLIDDEFAKFWQKFQLR